MMRKLLALLALSLSFVACDARTPDATTAANGSGSGGSANTQAAPPIARFAASQTSGPVPLTLSFTNLSEFASSFLWEFENGVTSTAPVPGPITITDPGPFQIKLTATGQGGVSSTVTFIQAYGLTQSLFTASPTTGVAPLTVSFVNNSQFAQSYLWDFGNGSNSTLQNPPPVTYTTPGTREVRLTTTGSTGVSVASVTIEVIGPPVANFSVSSSLGVAPLTVQFTDTTTGSPTSWQWDFQNDGTIDSTLRNPTFVYATGGAYSVRLVATNIAGTNTVVRNNVIFLPGEAQALSFVQPTTYSMGSTAGGPEEQPVHSVTFAQPFWIGKFEVTQAQYEAITLANPSFFQGVNAPDAPLRPVDSVTWSQARAYCAQLTALEAAAGRVPTGYEYRLPTEAEWEYCCRASTTTEWHFGTSLTTANANYEGALASVAYAAGQTAPVGSYPANLLGLHDMHGNVSEWCLDTYAAYTSAPVIDPLSTGGPNVRMLRGGSWNQLTTAFACRSAYRNFAFPELAVQSNGFRVVLGPIRTP